MKKTEWDEFKKTAAYKNLGEQTQQAIAHLYLENIRISKELLRDLIRLGKGIITIKELKKKAIKRAMSHES